MVLGNLEEHFCILAFGKLGGRELNYSSDIDLVGVFDVPDGSGAKGGADPEAFKQLYANVMERVSLDLSRHTEAGYAYRVDLRLRPHGQAGDLVPSFSGLMDYYRREASLWEIQAALKNPAHCRGSRTGEAVPRRDEVHPARAPRHGERSFDPSRPCDRHP